MNKPALVKSVPALWTRENKKGQLIELSFSLSKKPRRVSRPMGAKGTAIIFGGGVYVAENTFRGAQCRIVRLWRTTEARSAAPVPIGRSRPGDFIVKKGRRGPFLTVSGRLEKGARMLRFPAGAAQASTSRTYMGRTLGSAVSRTWTSKRGRLRSMLESLP